MCFLPFLFLTHRVPKYFYYKPFIAYTRDSERLLAQPNSKVLTLHSVQTLKHNKNSQSQILHKKKCRESGLLPLRPPSSGSMIFFQPLKSMVVPVSDNKNPLT